MSHLDAEFKKQTIPAVKSLITDQVCFPFLQDVFDFIMSSFKESKFTAPYAIVVTTDLKELVTSWSLKSISK